MDLPHGRRQPALPLAVELAEARIAVALGIAHPMLLPQQHEGDARPAQLAMDGQPIRLGLAPRAGRAAGAGEQQRFQRRFAERRRQRPAEPGRRSARQVVTHGAARYTRAARDRPVAGAALMLQAENLSDTTHRRSLGWHRLPPSLTRDGSLCGQPQAERPPPQGGRLQIGIDGRFRSEQVAGFKSESAADFKLEWVADLRRNPHTRQRQRRYRRQGVWQFE